MTLLSLLFFVMQARALELDAPEQLRGCALRAPLSATLANTNQGSTGTIVHLRPATGGVNLTITDRGGRPLIAREIPGGAPACAALIDGLTLVIERYLADIVMPREPRSATVQPQASLADRSLPAIVGDADRWGFGGELRVGGGWQTSTSEVAFTTAAVARAGRSFWYLALEANLLHARTLMLRELRPDGAAGEASHRSMGFLAGGGGCASWPSRRRLCAEAKGGLERHVLSFVDPGPRAGGRTRWTPLGKVEARWRLLGSRLFRAAVVAELALRPIAPDVVRADNRGRLLPAVLPGLALAGSFGAL